jgi:hypothetical protein
MDNSLFMEHFIYGIAAIILFFFFVGIIGAIIFAAYKQLPESMSFSARLKCLCGFHQGEWTKIGCYQRRYCISCGELQDQEKHRWPSRVGMIAGSGDLSFEAYAKAYGEYFQDGSCEKRVACLVCKEHKPIGKDHEGPKHWWSSTCKRCGEYLGEGD